MASRLIVNCGSASYNGDMGKTFCGKVRKIGTRCNCEKCKAGRQRRNQAARDRRRGGRAARWFGSAGGAITKPAGAGSAGAVATGGSTDSAEPETVIESRLCGDATSTQD